jgi:hypothetical protein
MISSVIPAKAGIPLFLLAPGPSGTPAFAGVTEAVADSKAAQL